MYLTAKSWKLRQQARNKLLAGEVAAAWELAAASLEIQSTASGEALVKLSEWLSHSAAP